jgi:PAS domain S-box-containing protein
LRSYVRIARRCSETALLLGLASLTCWILGIPDLTELLPGLTAIAPSTVMACILLAVALRLEPGGDAWTSRRRASVVLAGTVAVLGAAMLARSWVGFGRALDSVLFWEAVPKAGARNPGHVPSPHSAIAVSVIGTAIVTSRCGRRNAASWMSLASAGLCLLALFGYVHGVWQVLGITPLVRMSGPTALGLMLLSMALVAQDLEHGPLRFLLLPGIAGATLRRMFVIALFVPLILQLVVEMGEVAGFYDASSSAALFALVTMVGLAIGVGLSAPALVRAVEQREALVEERAAREAAERAAEALRRYELVAGHSRDIVLFMRRDGGRILEANAAALKAYGYGREELLAATIHDLRAPETVALTADQMAQADASGILFETVHRRKDGTTFPVEVSSQGTTLGATRTLVSFIRDITDRKRAERVLCESEERYRHLVQLSPDAIFVDRRGRIAFANPAAVELFGATSAEQIVGRPPFDLFHASCHDLIRERIAQVLRGDTTPLIEEKIVRLDGELRDVEVAAAPFDDQEGRAIQVILRDVTERRRAAEALQNADRRKSEFLAVLSHELRNPLAPIRNSLYLLEHAAPGSDQSTRAKDVIRRQTDHLARLVDDLLDVTRISRGKITLDRSRVDAREVVRRTCEDHRSIFERRGIHLSVATPATPVWIDADATRLAQVLGNLLQNAAKFTRENGSTSVSVTAAEGRAELRVRDDGIGIAPELLDRVFEPFAQAEHSLARTEGGLGLGLALVKGLVELHGGTATASSRGAGSGSEFVVRLPLAPDAGRTEVAARPAAAASPRTILVIEDYADSGRTLAEVLTIRGHSVHLATDGRSGLNMARDMRPDIVLCDIGLPDMDGYEVARTIRSDDALRPTYLVALSGYTQSGDKQRALDAGFDAHLGKPASLDELNEVLARSSANAQLGKMISRIRM